MAKATLLIVDDNPIVREVFKASLEEAGFHVVTLDSALRIYGAIRDHQPDLILLDISMPALSGDKAASFLNRRRFGPAIPVLLFSDREEVELEKLAAECGAAGYVRKSPDHRELLGLIDRVLSATV